MADRLSLASPAPIETAYNGFRFRSRLEARWAVFLDSVGISYEYEKEGFDLRNGRYLPDFWVPSLDAWIEIKGADPDSDSRDFRAPWELSQATNKRVYLFHGQAAMPQGEWSEPENSSAYAFLTKEDMLVINTQEELNDYPREDWWWFAYWWTECPACRAVGIAFGGRARELRCKCIDTYAAYCDTPRLTAAYQAARSARFEYGDTPRGIRGR